MYELSKKERRQVEQTLKGFAFEQSPMFFQGKIQGMAVQQSYDLQDNWEQQLPEDVASRDSEAEVFSPDQTMIELGFEAERIRDEDYKRPIYRFAARLVFSTFQLPQQVKLPADDWATLGADLAIYSDKDYDEDDQTVSKAEAIDLLTENMISCQKYRSLDYSYRTYEGIIRLNEETGYVIDDVPYGVIETHPAKRPSITEIEVSQDGSIASALANQSVVDNVLFEQAVSGLRDQYEEFGDIMSHQDKFDEFNFLLQCLKKRYLNLQ